MKIKFILDKTNDWLVCLEADDLEKEQLFLDRDTHNIAIAGVYLQTRESGLIGIFKIYGDRLEDYIIDYKSLAEVIDYLKKNEFFISNEEEAKKQHEILFQLNEKILSLQLACIRKKEQIEAFVKNTNSVKKLQDKLAEYQMYLLIVDDQIFAITQEITSDNILNQEIKDILFSKKISSQQPYYIKLKESIALLETKIENLKKIETFIENKENTEKIPYFISVLIPPTNKKLFNFILNEEQDQETSLIRYRLKGKALKEALGGKRQDISAITLYYAQLIKTESAHKASFFGIKDASHYILAEIATQDGKKNYFELPSNVVDIDNLSELFVSQGAYVDLASGRRGKGPLGESFFGGGLRKYDQKIESDYERIHAKIATKFVEKIGDKKDLIEVVFIGCGKGEEIKNIIKELQQKNLPYIIYALDIDENNIKIAKENFKGDKNVHFKAANALEIDQFIQDERKKNASLYKNKPSHSIAIASGCLTRLVNDPQEAFKIFQKTAHFVDDIIICGRTATLIKRSDAKQVGAQNEQEIFYSNDFNTPNTADLRTINTYHIDAEIDAKNRIEAAKKDNIIDLREHSRPKKVLEYIDQTKDKPENFWNNKQIDLRDAYLTSTEINFVANLVLQYKLEIIVTGNESWYQPLLEKIESPVKKPNTPLFFKHDQTKPPSACRITLKKSPIRFSSIKDQENIVHERQKLSENAQSRLQQQLNELPQPAGGPQPKKTKNN